MVILNEHKNISKEKLQTLIIEKNNILLNLLKEIIDFNIVNKPFLIKYIKFFNNKKFKSARNIWVKNK